MLAVQFPAILVPHEPGDFVAGRIRHGFVGISPEPCGLGYYCAFDPSAAGSKRMATTWTSPLWLRHLTLAMNWPRNTLPSDAANSSSLIAAPALHAGLDPLTRKQVVEGISGPDEMRTFEAVWDAYMATVEHFVRASAVQQKFVYDATGREAPFLFTSMLTSDCLARGRGAYEAGVRHLGGTLETYGNINAADSLHVIDELVFCRKQISLPDLVAALDHNFEEHGDIRSDCLGIKKYGNDEATSDEMARRVHGHVCRFTRDQAKAVGLDFYLVVIINNLANTVLGWKTSASADGRSWMSCAPTGTTLKVPAAA